MEWDLAAELVGAAGSNFHLNVGCIWDMGMWGILGIKVVSTGLGRDPLWSGGQYCDKKVDPNCDGGSNVGEILEWSSGELQM